MTKDMMDTTEDTMNTMTTRQWRLSQQGYNFGEYNSTVIEIRDRFGVRVTQKGGRVRRVICIVWPNGIETRF